MARDTMPEARAARPRLRRSLTLAGTVFTIIGIVGVIAHYRTPHRAAVLGFSAFAPYLMLAAPLAAALFAAARRWYATLVAGVVCGVWILTLAPLYVAADPPAHARELTVMTANVHLGRADVTALSAAVQRYHVDVLILEEVSLDEWRRLATGDVHLLLPFHFEQIHGSAVLGASIWSRYPLSEGERRPDFTFAFLTTRVFVPGLPQQPLVVALHMAGPWPDSKYWVRDMDHLPGVLRSLAARGGPMLVGGDFNATPDVVQFRRLLTDGFADAAQQAGAGYTATYPGDTWFGPLIAIDHVVTRGAVATSAWTVHLPGSDHRGLVTTIAIPTT